MVQAGLEPVILLPQLLDQCVLNITIVKSENFWLLKNVLVVEDMDSKQDKAEAGISGTSWLIRLAKLVDSGFNK